MASTASLRRHEHFLYYCTHWQILPLRYIICKWLPNGFQEQWVKSYRSYFKRYFNSIAAIAMINYFDFRGEDWCKIHRRWSQRENSAFAMADYFPFPGLCFAYLVLNFAWFEPAFVLLTAILQRWDYSPANGRPNLTNDLSGLLWIWDWRKCCALYRLSGSAAMKMSPLIHLRYNFRPSVVF